VAKDKNFVHINKFTENTEFVIKRVVEPEKEKYTSKTPNINPTNKKDNKKNKTKDYTYNTGNTKLIDTNYNTTENNIEYYDFDNAYDNDGYNNYYDESYNNTKKISDNKNKNTKGNKKINNNNRKTNDYYYNEGTGYNNEYNKEYDYNYDANYDYTDKTTNTNTNTNTTTKTSTNTNTYTDENAVIYEDTYGKKKSKNRNNKNNKANKNESYSPRHAKENETTNIKIQTTSQNNFFVRDYVPDNNIEVVDLTKEDDEVGKKDNVNITCSEDITKEQINTTNQEENNKNSEIIENLSKLEKENHLDNNTSNINNQSSYKAISTEFKYSNKFDNFASNLQTKTNLRINLTKIPQPNNNNVYINNTITPNRYPMTMNFFNNNSNIMHPNILTPIQTNNMNMNHFNFNNINFNNQTPERLSANEEFVKRITTKLNVNCKEFVPKKRVINIYLKNYLRVLILAVLRQLPPKKKKI
jgi:hypothetical protein